MLQYVPSKISMDRIPTYVNVCRTVNKRLTQYGKARELKPFDEFVLFPLFLSSLCAFSLELRGY